jgi:hypothetical protein
MSTCGCSGCVGPDELPSERQPYHGANEFIVDAMTVAGPAEVMHWDEQEGERRNMG